jgi:hypothetical protein
MHSQRCSTCLRTRLVDRSGPPLQPRPPQVCVRLVQADFACGPGLDQVVRNGNRRRHT